MSSNRFDPPGNEIIRRTTTTTYSRRVPWLPLLAAVIVVPLVLAALAAFTGLGVRDGIKDDLASRSRAALSDSGLSDAEVSVDGRDVTVAGVPSGREDDAKNAVQSLDGVRTVAVSADDAVQQPPSPIDVAVTPDNITLTGSAPDDATKRALIDAANSKANGKPVVDKITTPGSTPAIDGTAVAALITGLGASGATARVDEAGVTLTGTVANDADKANVENQVRSALPGKNLSNQLTVAPPPPPPPPAFDKAGLQGQINGFIAGQPITFVPDTATLTAEGARTVAQIADALKGAPEARVEIDGHVAQTPGPSPNAQPLSEQRAQAVRAQLQDAGIAPDRMTAVGFAADRPIAPNNTSAGQAANRRVEIIVL